MNNFFKGLITGLVLFMVYLLSFTRIINVLNGRASSTSGLLPLIILIGIFFSLLIGGLFVLIGKFFKK